MTRAESLVTRVTALEKEKTDDYKKKVEPCEQMKTQTYNVDTAALCANVT